MNLLMTGATGLIGRRFIESTPHTVTVLSRSPERAVEQLGPRVRRAFRWEPMAGPPPAEAFEGIDAVVHLAGESVVGRWTAAKRAAIRDSRVVGTRHLVDALAELPQAPRTLISASAIGFYGDRGDEDLTETALPGAGFLADVCREWEAEARRAERLDVRVVNLRIGIVLDADGGALGSMLPVFRRGLGGPLGSGSQWWSWIELDDLVALADWALGASVSGGINAVAPGAVRQRGFATALGAALGRPARLRAPAFALKLALGGFSRELLFSRRVTPARALEAGFRFRCETIDDALAGLARRGKEAA